MSDMTVGLPFKDIPQTVLDDVMGSLKNYLIGIYVLLQEKPQPRLRVIGSGTLVDLKGTHHILTAAHVWHETRGTDEVGIVLTDDQTAFTIPRNSISAKDFWDGKLSEWGPDLALLKLPEPSVSTIAAYKSFLTLDLQKEALASYPPTTENGLWAVTGIVGEQSEIRRYPDRGVIEGHLQGRAFFSSIQQVHLRDGYDYFDLGANLQLPDVPSSFGGISGGGLWDVKLLMTESKQIVWDEKRYFRGVAFWQTESTDNRRMIRCHGPKSIFEMAWES